MSECYYWQSSNTPPSSLLRLRPPRQATNRLSACVFRGISIWLPSIEGSSEQALGPWSRWPTTASRGSYFGSPVLAVATVLPLASCDLLPCMQTGLDWPLPCHHTSIPAGRCVCGLRYKTTSRRGWWAVRPVPLGLSRDVPFSFASSAANNPCRRSYRKGLVYIALHPSLYKYEVMMRRALLKDPRAHFATYLPTLHTSYRLLPLCTHTPRQPPS
ncbi:hypothetical protein J3F83DRAFT_620780 [Trichoderma novae-zelandiae]